MRNQRHSLKGAIYLLAAIAISLCITSKAVAKTEKISLVMTGEIDGDAPLDLTGQALIDAFKEWNEEQPFF